MSHDHSKDTKRQNKEFEKAYFFMPPEIGRYPNKIGTHPHKQKKFQNMAVGLSCCCGGAVTGCGQTSTEMALIKNDIALKGKKKTLKGASRCDSLTKNHYATTRQVGQHRQLHTSRHVQPREPIDFAQTAMFNTTTTLHSTRHVQQHQPVNFTEAHSSTTSSAVKVHQLHIYNNQQQQRHKWLFPLISPKSVGLAFIVYFHFTLYRHNKPY